MSEQPAKRTCGVISTPRVREGMSKQQRDFHTIARLQVLPPVECLAAAQYYCPICKIYLCEGHLQLDTDGIRHTHWRECIPAEQVVEVDS